MSSLVVGEGYIGTRLRDLLSCAGTSRRRGSPLHYFDLLDPDPLVLETFDTVYLCAGANGAKRCEGVQEAYRVNVDAPIEISRYCQYMVWISSMSIEWLEGAYQRQKRSCEGVLRTMKNVGIIRAGRVVNENLDDLCKTMIEMGEERFVGLRRWGNDDISYRK